MPQAGTNFNIFLCAARSSIKTTVLVFLYNDQKLFKILDLGIWLVAMPLQIRSLPIDFPHGLGFYISRFGKRKLHFLTGLASPNLSDLNHFDTLSYNPTTEINFGSDVWWWSSTIQVPLDYLLTPFCFEFTDGHTI
jgi:hypothetical protein